LIEKEKTPLFQFMQKPPPHIQKVDGERLLPNKKKEKRNP
jgi:hypothetical protein